MRMMEVAGSMLLLLLLSDVSRDEAWFQSTRLPGPLGPSTISAAAGLFEA
jgi:hypothetical protein